MTQKCYAMLIEFTFGFLGEESVLSEHFQYRAEMINVQFLILAVDEHIVQEYDDETI